jgi:DMSO/TMAO reductase YedYZ molybdopterin-dependent catalytic subunit
MTLPPLDPTGPVVRHPLQPHQLVERTTPTEDTIVLCHVDVPRLDAADWTLSIDGLVRRPLRLTFADLLARPRVEIASIHQCCGNPLRPGVPTRRICNVTWTGARLADLLADCQPDPTARFVWSSGADHGTLEGVRCDAYVKDLPLDRVADDVLIAYEMNGAALRPENGYPARLVVPGFYGTNSVKWLRRLTLARERASGPFTTRWYNDVVADALGRPNSSPVWSIAPECVIVSPAPESTIGAAKEIWGWGWAWADGGVAAVEVSVDGTATWMNAAVEPPAGHAWQRFTFPWRPGQRGSCELSARARSTDAPPAALGSPQRHPSRSCQHRVTA